jgi:hypothetical protein
MMVKWPGCETDHSPPPSAEVKNAWSCTYTSPYVFLMYFIKHKDSFTLTFTWNM